LICKGIEITLKNNDYVYFKYPLDSMQDIKKTKHYIILQLGGVPMGRFYKKSIKEIKHTIDGKNWIEGIKRIGS